MVWYHALFSFQGRLNRQGFWIGIAVNFLFLFAIANFIVDLTAYTILSLTPFFISLYSLISIIIKRLHDRNRSGWAVLMIFVPIACYAFSLGSSGTIAWLLGLFMPMFIGTVLLLEWGFFQSFPKPNRYGEKGLSFSFKSVKSQ